MNLSQTIIPKSDQLNADDLIAGPRTIRITDVRAGNAEQPVSIFFDGDNGRPYKPGKSMRRVLIELWGAESQVYIGRRLTIYRDSAVRFGNDDVGGIRISHASDIEAPVVMALTVTRGKRKPYTVHPLPSEQPAFDAQAVLDEGEAKAREGMTALRAWYGNLPAKAKLGVKAKLDLDWKRAAEEADKAKQAAA